MSDLTDIRKQEPARELMDLDHEELVFRVMELSYLRTVYVNHAADTAERLGSENARLRAALLELVSASNGAQFNTLLGQDNFEEAVYAANAVLGKGE